MKRSGEYTVVDLDGEQSEDHHSKLDLMTNSRCWTRDWKVLAPRIYLGNGRFNRNKSRRSRIGNSVY